MTTPPEPGVPFTFFSALIRQISKIPPSPPGKSPSTTKDHPATRVFERWTTELRRQFSPLPSGTTAICFRFLFPEEDIQRKYDIQENRLTNLIANCYGMDSTSFDLLGGEEATGCLGHEVKSILMKAFSEDRKLQSQLTLLDVDCLLNELAAKSGYSSKLIRNKYSLQPSRTRNAIIRSLFRDLTPYDAAVLTQIILKDLRPLLYPLNEFHYSIALTKFNTASVKPLTKELAMNIWDPSGGFLQYYQVSPDMDLASAHADLPVSLRPKVYPKVGNIIAIPKSEKGRGCAHALSLLGNSERIWAETKYDGERTQIHVELKEDRSHITIFSKSKRDSTLDRCALHNIIRSALGLSGSATPAKANRLIIQRNIILDAEMVAFRGEDVDEFWKIRQLIEDSADGVRHFKRVNHDTENSGRDSCSLGIVFFDVLLIDSRSLLSQPYSQRRDMLEKLITTIPGQSILSKRFPVDKGKQSSRILAKIFADCISRSEEGLILKAEQSRYNDFRTPWVKIKRDYLPDARERLDLVILGAAWEKIRGRSLRVPPSTYTTFFIGAAIKADSKGSGEHPNGDHHTKTTFYLYFTASYGLTRNELERLNFAIKSSNPQPFSPEATENLPYKLEVFRGLNRLPSVILCTPLLHYELRFPRILRFYLPSERNWQHALSLEQVHAAALESLGRDRADKDISDWANTTWGRIVSPKASSHSRQRVKSEYWEEMLLRLDGDTKLPSVSNSMKRLKPTSYSEDVDRHLIRRKMDSLPLQRLIDSSPLSATTQFLDTGGPWRTIANDVLVWFARPSEPDYNPCPSLRKWRNHITRERRLHCLDSLLIGGGIIVVDECVESTDKWLNLVKERVILATTSTVTPKILLYSCRSQLAVATVE
ncbi:hypothetical protein CPB83DRAFT_896582 [Crepidotus variabilis]|uniref:ATP-dependent DNA ligase family profile domain-containing protein n=1 Tax=Crepidotus variabilis TaxID=179855 RepID=A0A9P6EBW4_9AGAR|nr:hypothetical protein CPB83DRAFT_896582 [Crepidotus variabilis]